MIPAPWSDYLGALLLIAIPVATYFWGRTDGYAAGILHELRRHVERERNR